MTKWRRKEKIAFYSTQIKVFVSLLNQCSKVFHVKVGRLIWSIWKLFDIHARRSKQKPTANSASLIHKIRQFFCPEMSPKSADLDLIYLLNFRRVLLTVLFRGWRSNIFFLFFIVLKNFETQKIKNCITVDRIDENRRVLEDRCAMEGCQSISRCSGFHKLPALMITFAACHAHR